MRGGGRVCVGREGVGSGTRDGLSLRHFGVDTSARHVAAKGGGGRMKRGGAGRQDAYATTSKCGEKSK